MKPKKERPTALPDSIFAGKNELGHVPEDIPVQNTFIQFGAPPSAGADQKKPLSTAPAWIGPDFNTIMKQATADDLKARASGDAEAAAVGESFFAPEGNGEPFFKAEDDDGTERPPLGSPQKISSRLGAQSSPNRQVGSSGATFDPVIGPPPANGEAPAAAPGSASTTSTAGLPPPPDAAPPAGPLPSMGSAQHAEGACKRCCFFPKGRCQNGYNCEFCHFEHEKRKRKKKKKGAKKADQDSGSDDDEEEDDENAPGDHAATEGATQQSTSARATRKAKGDDKYAAWQHDAIGTRGALPLTALPVMPPRGLPPPMDPALPLPGLPGYPGADPYYGGGYDPYDLAFGAGAYNPYAAAFDRLDPLGSLSQSYFGGGYDPAAIAAQQHQAAYQQPTGRYLPPPR